MEEHPEDTSAIHRREYLQEYKLYLKEKVTCDVCDSVICRGYIDRNKRTAKCKASLPDIPPEPKPDTINKHPRNTYINIPLDKPDFVKNFPHGSSMDELSEYFKQNGYDLNDHIEYKIRRKRST